MTNRFLSRACAGQGQRAQGSNRFFDRAGLPEEALAQVQSAELTVDASTTAVDPVFATLLSVSITTSGGDLLVWFSVSGNSSAVVIPEFRIVLDGTPIAGGSGLFINPTFIDGTSHALHLENVAAGAHMIDAEWAKIPGSGAAIVMNVFPVTLPNRHHASLIVGEVGA